MIGLETDSSYLHEAGAPTYGNLKVTRMGSTVYCYLENLFLHIQMGTFIYFKTFRKSIHYYLFYNFVIYFGFIVSMKIDPALDKRSTYCIVGAI